MLNRLTLIFNLTSKIVRGKLAPNSLDSAVKNLNKSQLRKNRIITRLIRFGLLATIKNKITMHKMGGTMMSNFHLFINKNNKVPYSYTRALNINLEFKICSSIVVN